jgi:hypothetical protein
MAERFRLIAFAACAVVLWAASSATAVSYGDLEFIVEPEPRNQGLHGYTEYRVFVRNRGTEETRRVTLMLPGDSHSSNTRGTLQSISRTVDVGPGLTVPISLFQPANPDVFGQGIGVRIDGRREERLLPLNPTASRGPMGGGMYGYHPRYARRGRMMYSSGPGMGGGNEPLLLLSQRIPENFFQRTTKAMLPGGPGVAPGIGAGAPGGGPAPAEPAPGGAGAPGGAAAPGGGAAAPPGAGGGGGPPAAGPPPPPAMGGPGFPGGAAPGGFAGGPGGMSGFGPTLINLVNSQFERSNSPISAWSSHWLGYTRYDGIAVTREDLEELQRGSNETRAVLGTLWQYVETGGALIVLGPGQVNVPAGWLRQASERTGFRQYQVGFGVCLVAPDRNGDKWPDDRWSTINSVLGQTASPFLSTKPLTDLNTTFPVVDDLGVPVRGLFALMMIFGIALGPVNLVILSKKKKRIWMLWTVPALSAFTCMVVFGYMIFAEGWQGHARVGGITYLNEIDRRASSLGRTAFYSPLTPGDGLRFSDDTEVHFPGGEFGTSCSIDWTQGQHLSRGWVTARVPAHYALRKCEPRRERLNIRRESNGTLNVVNALGADIQTLWVADEKGVLYTAGPIGAGERATLERSSKKPVRVRKHDSWRRLYTQSDWTTTANNAVRQPEEVLGPRTYLAVVEGSPFLEQGLRGAAVRANTSVVLGLMADLGGK